MLNKNILSRGGIITTHTILKKFLISVSGYTTGLSSGDTTT